MKEIVGKQIESVWLSVELDVTPGHHADEYMAFVTVDGSTICYQAEGD